MKPPINPLQKALLVQLLKLQESNQKEGGYALVATVAMIVLLTGLFLTASIVGTIDASSTRASEKSSKGFFAAEAGLNIRAQEVRDKFIGYNRPAGTSPSTWEDCTDASNANDGSVDFACDTSLTINGQTLATYVVDQTGNTPELIPVPEGRYKGLNAQEYRYDVLSVALAQEGNDTLPSSILGMRFKSRLVPLFQFAIFYNDDIDFSIPPDMTINGRIHSNNNIFVNSGNSNLTLNSIITSGGTLYRGGKTNAGTWQCSGTVTIPDKNGNNRNLDCSGNNITPYQNNTTTPSNLSNWENVITTDVEPLTIPSPSEFSAATGGRYWDAADLRVVLNLDNSSNPTGIEIQNADGTQNTTATTNLLNNCPVTERTLVLPSLATSTLLTLSSAGFNNGDVLTIGSDLDSNVISSGGGTNLISLKRRVGHPYQNAATTWLPLTKVRKAVVSTSDTFHNYREKSKVPAASDGTIARPIRMLNVDVRALLECANDQNLMGKALDDASEGGLVWFFTVKGPDSNIDKSNIPFQGSNTSADVTGNNYGIRLYNGKHLYSTDPNAPIPKGLTVVSDQAVYLRGDYNVDRDETNTTVDFDGNSTINDSDKNTWIPAAVMADTINILSNSWEMDDSDSRGYDGNNLPTISTNYTSRVPSETTMNVAFLAGTDKTGGSNGITGTMPTSVDFETGGVNNYPRFHERWSATATTAQACDAIYNPDPTRWCFNYRGSFVSLFEPKRVNSRFCDSGNTSKCNIYTPPVRNWDYDTRFNDAANLPPMTPRAVFLTQELFEREFSYNSSKPNQMLLASLLPSTPQSSIAQATNRLHPSFIF